jgi:hypothetical protein
MELLCALLTGFSFWLFVFHWRRQTLVRLRDMAGDLVFAARYARVRIWRWLLLAYLLFGLVSNIGSALYGHNTDLPAGFGFAVMLALVLMLAVPLRGKTALEIRARGVLCENTGSWRLLRMPIFVPWNQITTCQWVPRSYGHVSEFYTDRCGLTIALDAIPREQQAGVTAAVGRFAYVYDQDGTLLAKPDEEHLNAKWVSWRSIEGPRFQFTLQSLLLLAVVVASAAGLCGAHFHSPHYQAITRLAAFNPRSHFVKHDYSWLDFSACTFKPTDDDLVDLEPLAELEWLDLSGCPITDAGLKHLKGLKNLRTVILSHTGVTREGMKDLQRALPDVSIGAIRYPPPAKIVAPPTKRQPHP